MHKAVIKRDGDVIIVEPKNDFWSLEGILASEIKLSDKQLGEARKSFLKNWPRK